MTGENRTTDRVTRRDLLAALGTTAGVGLAGCSGLTVGTGESFGGDEACSAYDPVDPERTTWPVAGGGAAGTGTVASAAAPGTDLTADWRVPVETTIGYHTPVVDDDTAYVHDLDEALLAVAAATGDQRWDVSVKGPTTAPAVADDRLVLVTEDGVEGRDTATGERRWTVDGHHAHLFDAPPVVADGTAYLVDGVSVDAIDLADGTERWRVVVGLPIDSRPAVADDTLFVASDDTYVRALATSDGTERWRYKTEAHVQCDVAAVRDTVYACTEDGTVLALGAEDGANRWQYQLSSSDRIDVGSLAADGSRVYVGTDDGLFVFDATTGTPCWRTEFYENSYASGVAVADGRLYLPANWRRGASGAVFDAATGERQSTFAAEDDQGFSVGPSIAQGALYTAGRGGLVRYS